MIVRVKRGETLNLSMQFQQIGTAAPAPIDVSLMTLTATVRDAQNNFVASLPLTKQPVIGLVTTSQVDTSQWPLGHLRCDLRAAFNGNVVKSETFEINVGQAVTQP